MSRTYVASIASFFGGSNNTNMSAGAPSTTAVIVTWLVMVIVFYQTNVDADSSQIRSKEALDEVYLALQSFGTGKNYSANDIARLSAADVEGMIRKLYGDVICCFTSKAIYHQSAVTYFVATGNVKKSLFDREAQLMLILVYWLKGGSDGKMRPLWLVYTYQMYLLSVVPDLEVFPLIHDAVTVELVKFKVDECRQRSHATGYQIQEDGPTLESDWESPKKCIVRSEQMSEYAENNEQVRRAVAHYDRGFSPECLHLNHIIGNERVLTNLLRDFGQQEHWVAPVNTIRARYGQVEQQKRPDLWAKCLGGFLGDFIDLLKVLMLRFICKHLLHLNHELRYTEGSVWFSGFNWSQIAASRTLNEYSGKALFLIKEFVEFLDFSDDPHFRYVLGLLKKPDTHLKTVDKRNAAFHNVKDTMDGISKSLEITVSCPETLDVDDEAKFLNMITQTLAPLNHIDVVNNKLTVTVPRQLLVHSISVMSVFVQYIQQNLAGVDTKVIKSFIDFTKELKTLVMEESYE